MEQKVSFLSGNHALSGILHLPEGIAEGEKRPGMLVLHGFGTGKDSGTTKAIAALFAELGYVALRFDFRGCGESAGERGRIICMEQVEDVRNAVTWLGERADVDAGSIGLMGHSFGAAVAIYSGATDERVAGVISSGGWGDGEEKFRKQHPGEAAWKRFSGMLEEGKRHKQETGESKMVARWEIVPIPEHLRKNLGADSIMEFPVETAQSMFDFKANDVVAKLAPRPLMLFHSANDSVTPTEQSLELFRRAGQPTELYLMADIDHFPFSKENPRARAVLNSWLSKFMPVKAEKHHHSVS